MADVELLLSVVDLGRVVGRGLRDVGQSVQGPVSGAG